jgi:hypothetical protein
VAFGKLIQLIGVHFSTNDFENLCLLLGIVPESLPGESKVLRLVRIFARQDRIDDLIKVAKSLRPALDWDEVSPVNTKQLLEEELIEIVITYDELSGYSSQKLTPSTLATELSSYLGAIVEFQRIIDRVRNRLPRSINISSITQNSPVTVTVNGVLEAVQLIVDVVIPERRARKKRMEDLKEAEQKLINEIKKAEVLERRARASKEREDARRLADEAFKCQLEAEKMRREIEESRWKQHKEQIQLALEVWKQMSSDLADEQKLFYIPLLLAPLKDLTDGSLQISEYRIAADSPQVPNTPFYSQTYEVQSGRWLEDDISSSYYGNQSDI